MKVAIHFNLTVCQDLKSVPDQLPLFFHLSEMFGVPAWTHFLKVEDICLLLLRHWNDPARKKLISASTLPLPILPSQIIPYVEKFKLNG